jgi:hypothetical protein
VTSNAAESTTTSSVTQRSRKAKAAAYGTEVRVGVESGPTVRHEGEIRSQRDEVLVWEDDASDPRYRSEHDGVGREAASSIPRSLDEEQLLIVAAKLADRAYCEIASRLNIRRRTAAYRKAIVFGVLAEQLDHLTDAARLECFDRLAPTLQAALLQS